MTRRHTLLATVAAALVAAAAVVLFIVLGGDDKPDPAPRAVAASQPSPRPVESTPPTGIGEPTHLRIPAIDVDADVVPVGTTAGDAQEVPPSLRLVGWWRDGVQPGAPGNAVIVGHTASSDDGVFDALSDVSAGDEVVVDAKDDRETFRVATVDEVPVEDFATVADDVYRAKGAAGLVLMTCGDWNGSEYETTVIVHAAPA